MRRSLASADRLASRGRAVAALDRGKVFVNDVEATRSDAARRLAEGDRVRVWMDRPGSAQKRYSERHDAGMHLLYEDASLLVINKPAGLLTVPLDSQPDEPSLLDQLRNHLRPHRHRQPLIVHRIDRDTSGIVVFTKSHVAQQRLKAQFQHREAERIYLAIVYGHPAPESGVWKDLLVWNQDQFYIQSFFQC